MTNSRIRCNSVEMPKAPSNSATCWVQVTQEIDAKGYGGGPFKFDRTTFEQLQKNLRLHPAFKLGADGFGSADVVPWDVGHATENNPGNAPAQGWVQDLDIREGADGKAQLWAKTRWLENMRQAINGGQYKWASVVVLFDARDPVTNEDVGALLTSVAVTNTPFVEGMAPLVAASRQATEAPTKHVVIKLPYGVSRHSPQGRAMLAQLARRLSTPASPAAPDAAGDDAAATAEEQALLQQTREQLSQRRAPAAAKLDATKEVGRNRTERAIACMSRRVDGFSKLSWDEQVARAGEALRLGVVSA
jgi:hypothetical protein